MFIYFIIIIILGLPAIITVLAFVKFLFTGKSFSKKELTRILEVVTVIGLPLFYLLVLDQDVNDCCNESATFSPNHKLTIYLLVSICIIAYFYSSFKESIYSPILEVATNCFLLFGIVLNIVIAIQVDLFISLFGNLPIIILFLFQLINNQKHFSQYSANYSPYGKNSWEKLAWKVLKLKPIYKIPILLIFCLPLLTIITSFLLLFGQKPDSLIKAFTDTYKHGFSQLDHLCDNVDCGGHFLCSVAANGHKKIVKPERYGERAGKRIICNRQLLISNAFEELVEQEFPNTHQIIRLNYNKVGNMIHRYYNVFNNKYLADFIYFLMKPLELLFLLTLYTFDKRPENRISKQYLSPLDRQMINEKINVS
jgi:hypothetical protein